MKRLVIAFTLMAAAGLASGGGAKKSTSMLMMECIASEKLFLGGKLDISSEQIDALNCNSTISTHAGNAKAFAEKEGIPYCPKAGTTMGSVTVKWLQWIRTQPELWDEPAGGTIVAFIISNNL